MFDRDLYPIFKLFALRDLGPCYALRDEISQTVSDALASPRAELRSLLEQLVAVHRAGVGLALANDLPTLGIEATAREWLRQLRFLRTKPAAADVLVPFREPATWDLYACSDREVPGVFRQAFLILARVGTRPNLGMIVERLESAGLRGAARILTSTPFPATSQVRALPAVDVPRSPPSRPPSATRSSE
jgi:hypothetical protein